MGTRGVPPCSLHTCAWSGTCWNKSYLLFGECQVCVAQTGHRHARVVGSAPIARGPRSQCRSRPWWRRCQCLQPGFHMFMWTWWVLCQPPRVATPTSSPWWTDLQDGQRKKKSEEWVPVVITSDRGVQFTSSRWSSWCKQVGAKHITTTTFHPQSNGMVERFHRQLKAALKTCRGSLHGKSNFLEPYWDSGQHPRTSLEFPRGRWPWGCNWPS